MAMSRKGVVYDPAKQVYSRANNLPAIHAGTDGVGVSLKRNAKKAARRARPHWQSRRDSSAGAMEALLNGDINLTWG